MQKKYFVLLLLTSPLLTTAQFGNFINRVKDKVVQKSTARADNKVDKYIDKTLDKIEGKTDAPIVTTETDGNKGSNFTSFTKYDFVTGEQIVYAEDFSQEAIAELPLGWNTNGSGEVVTIENISGNWLRLHKSNLYLSANSKIFSFNYTVEFDLILQLKNNGWMYPAFSVGLISTGDKATTDNYFLTDWDKYTATIATIYPQENNNSKAKIELSKDSRITFTSEVKDYGALDQYYGRPVHIAIQVQNQRLRMWINQTKVFDIPKGVDTTYKMNQLMFKAGQTNYSEEQYGIFISNIKTATGLPDTRHKLVEEGKFSTTGILFDVNSSVIKPESNGVVKEIATVLKENPSIKIKIIGHTSSDGDDKVNMDLSSQRAAAVKTLLTEEFKIDTSRIETEGKGETEAVGDNKTKEGRSQNRRVEFIKQ